MWLYDILIKTCVINCILINNLSNIKFAQNETKYYIFKAMLFFTCLHDIKGQSEACEWVKVSEIENIENNENNQ